jgi:hypothetical protein
LAILLALYAIPLQANARSAEDYYHGAAYRYVEGKIQEAAAEAEEGLRAHPDDPKLRALSEQLRKMQDRQKGNPNQDPKDSGKDKDKNKDGGKDKDKNSGDRDKRDEGSKNPKDPNKSGQGNPDDPSNAKQPPPGSGQNPDRPEARKPGEMSRQEAERLLNSFADDEKKEQAERRRVVRPRSGTEQDW